MTFEGSVGGAGSGGNGGDASEGVKVEEALGGLHNNNGLGRGERGDVVLIGSAASGELTVARRSERSENNGGEAGEEAKLTPIEHIQLETTIDNPSYFKDEFATPEDDASGYVLAGLVRAVDLPKDVDKVGGVVPSLVQILRRNETAVARGGDGTTMGTGPGEKRGEDRGGDVSRKDKAWAKPKVVFQDDGKRVSGAATAVLVGVDPKETGGRKKGWLFVTGFMTNSVVATLIDL